MIKINYKKLGEYCQQFRSYNLMISQSDVAVDINLGKSSVSMFETGNSRSTDLLIWYIVNGLPVDYIKNSIEEI